MQSWPLRVPRRPSRAHGAGLIPHTLEQAGRAHRSKASNGPSGSSVEGMGDMGMASPRATCPKWTAPSLHGGQGRFPPPGSTGDNAGCPDLTWDGAGVVNIAEHSSSKFGSEQPWEWESVGRGLQALATRRAPKAGNAGMRLVATPAHSAGTITSPGRWQGGAGEGKQHTYPSQDKFLH